MIWTAYSPMTAGRFCLHNLHKRNKIYIHHAVIEQTLNQSGYTGLRHLSIIYLLKKVYGASGHIHSTSNQSLAPLSHIAGRTRIKAAISYGVSMGWVKRHTDGSISFPTLVTLSGDIPKQRELVVIEKKQNHQGLLDYIFEITFRTQSNRQDYCSSTSQSLNKPKSAKEYKAALKNKDKMLRSRGGYCQAWEERGFNKSYLGFSRLYQVSTTHAFYLVGSLIKKGIITKRNNVRLTEIPNEFLTCPFISTQIKECNKWYRKGANGFLIQQLPNSYSFVKPNPMN